MNNKKLRTARNKMENIALLDLTDDELYDELYHSITTLEDLYMSYRMFVEGILKISITHLGSIYDMDTTDLLKLYNYDIITLDGQSGNCDGEDDYYITQRPYLLGLIPRGYVTEDFMDRLVEEGCAFIFIDWSTHKTICSDQLMGLTYERRGVTPEIISDMRNISWDNRSYMQYAVTRSACRNRTVDDIFRNLRANVKKSLSKNYTYFEIINKQICSDLTVEYILNSVLEN